MGKRYKKGNVGKKHKNSFAKQYMRNEVKLNKLIKQFWNHTYHELNIYDYNDYLKMNRLRLDIKALFDNQGKYLSRVGRKRRNIYYNQLSKFKKCYTYWKKKTYVSYVIMRYDVPVHLMNYLIYYRENA